MADQTIGPAWHKPRARTLRQVQRRAHSFCRRELGVGLLAVPDVGVADPIVLALEQHARLDATWAGAGIEREGLQECDAIVRLPLSTFRRFEPGVSGRADPMSGRRAVVPAGMIDLIRHYARRRLFRIDVVEKAGLAQLARERRGIRWFDIRRQSIKATVVINHQCFIVHVHAKADDHQRRVGEFALPENFLSVMTHRADAARRVIAVNVSAGQFGICPSAIDDAAGE